MDAGHTFAFGHDMLVHGVAQVDPVNAECGKPTDEGAVEDVSEGERCPVVLGLPQTQKGEQGHQCRRRLGIAVDGCILPHVIMMSSLAVHLNPTAKIAPSAIQYTKKRIHTHNVAIEISNLRCQTHPAQAGIFNHAMEWW